MVLEVFVPVPPAWLHVSAARIRSIHGCLPKSSTRIPDQIDLARLKNWSAGNAVLLE